MAEIPSYLQPSPATAAPAPEQPIVQANAPTPGSVALMRVQDKAIVHVPITDVDTAVRSGIYAPMKDAEFHVVDEQGNVSTTQGQHLHDVLNAGLKIEDARDTHAREVQAKYGDSSLRAFGEAAASSATFGASDVASRLAGVPAADLAGREEANPVASGLGTVAGFVPGLFTGGAEAGLAAKSLSMVGKPVAAASKAAAAAEKAVVGTIFKQGAAAGVEKTALRNITEKMVAGGVGGLVEGTFLGTGQLVHEAALGSAELNAESLLSHATVGGLIGGAFGASVGGAIAGLSYAGKYASKTADAVLSGFTNVEKTAFEAAGFTPSQIAKKEKMQPGFGSDLANYMKNDLKWATTETAESAAQKNAAIQETAGRGIGATIEAADDLAAHIPGVRPNAKNLNMELADHIYEKFLSKETTDVIAQREQKQIQQFYSDLVENKIDKELTIKELQSLRQTADLRSKMEKLQEQRTPIQEAYYEARNFYADKLRDQMKVVAERGGAEQLYGEFVKNNKLFSMSKQIEDKLAAKAAKGEQLNAVATAAFGMATGALSSQDLSGAGLGGLSALAGRKFLQSDIRKNLVVMGKIEKAQMTMDKVMNSAVKSFFKPAGKVLEPSALKTHELGKDMDGKKPANMSAAYLNFKKTMSAYEQNPEAFMQKLNRSTSLLQFAAPNTASILDAKTVKAMMFLGQKMPKQHSTPGVLDVLKKPKMPSNYDLAKFHRYLTAVDDPKTVVHDLQNGRISHEGVEALKEVYPTLYSKLQDKIVDGLQTSGHDLPYNRRVQLGSLFGIAADDSMLPQNVLSLQANFGQQPTQDGSQEPVIKPRGGGMNKLGAADRAASDTEKIGKA
jgi:hypothetical protein